MVENRPLLTFFSHLVLCPIDDLGRQGVPVLEVQIHHQTHGERRREDSQIGEDDTIRLPRRTQPQYAQHEEEQREGDPLRSR